MENNVIDISSRRPHYARAAICLSCKSEFTAVALAGALWFECPHCGLEKATWKHTFEFAKGTLIRSCACGNPLFYQSHDGIMCALCGEVLEVYNFEQQARSNARLKEELDGARRLLKELGYE